MNYNLCNNVYQHSLTNPHQLAVADNGISYTYQQLASSASALAALLQASPDWPADENTQPRVAILGSRSALACIAVLGASWAGATYIPFGTKLPEERILTLLQMCKVNAVIADAEGAKLLTENVLAACPRLVLIPNTVKPPLFHTSLKSYDFQSASTIQNKPANVAADAQAYIIFTSGTTGIPKGVIIKYGTIHHYLNTVTGLLGIQASDRAIETFELTFDVTLHTMFTTWQVGACLYILPATRVMNAVKFVDEHQVTIWFSVPSLAGMLKEIKALSPNSLASLRISIFGGEPLPEGLIKSWQLAAPNSRIENFYGPTEATVFCLSQTVDERLALTPGRDSLSIGTPMLGNEAAVVDSSQTFLAPGEIGELALSGVQISAGYLNSPELTKSRFPIIDGKRWYLTGDLAMQDADGRFHCLGRLDNQVKVLGHRVELEEVDTYLRKASNNSVAATVAWPIHDGVAQGLVCFVHAAEIDAYAIKTAMKQFLPSYMVPSRVVAIPNMPLNQSGKIDRKALINLLQTNAIP